MTSMDSMSSGFRELSASLPVSSSTPSTKTSLRRPPPVGEPNGYTIVLVSAAGDAA